MKNYILFPSLFVILAIFGGCAKSDTCSPNPPSNESVSMLAYATAHGMNMTAHSSGMYYEIITPGSGPVVTASSRIRITYTGLLLDGTEFDKMDTPNTSPWLLAGLIEGWQIGIPLIQKGGRIRMLIPSALAYGCKDYGPIPGNSPLFFDVALVDAQ